jgi:integrase
VGCSVEGCEKDAWARGLCREHYFPLTKYAAESYTRGEMKALIKACDMFKRPERMRALIALMWRAGLRLDEALSLRPIDVDDEYKTIRVLKGKGSKARTVAIDDYGLQLIDDWLALREAEPGSPLVCTGTGGKISQSWVRTVLPKLGAAAGVDRRVHAHGFRHTFTVELVREGVPMPLIQRLLGHSSLGTTSAYVASIAPEEALDAVRWRRYE